MKKLPRKKVKWFASGGGLALAGPYSTQAVAWKALRLVPGNGGLFPQDAKVWPDDRTRAEIDQALADDRKARALAEGRALVNSAVRRLTQ